MVWARKPRTYNIWYTGARLTGAASGDGRNVTPKNRHRWLTPSADLHSSRIGGASGVTKLQKKAPKALKGLDADLKSAPWSERSRAGGLSPAQPSSPPRLGARGLSARAAKSGWSISGMPTSARHKPATSVGSRPSE